MTGGGHIAPLTLPKERISADVDGKLLRNIKILQPSDDRVKPPCAHFKSCGGCALQHASAAFVEDWKVDVIREALVAHGIKTEMRPCLTSPPESRRRVTFSARRTKKGAFAGFHARRSNLVIEINHCDLIQPELRDALPIVKALAVAGASRKGTLAFRLIPLRQGWMSRCVVANRWIKDWKYPLQKRQNIFHSRDSAGKRR